MGLIDPGADEVVRERVHSLPRLRPEDEALVADALRIAAAQDDEEEPR